MPLIESLNARYNVISFAHNELNKQHPECTENKHETSNRIQFLPRKTLIKKNPANEYVAPLVKAKISLVERFLN